MAKRTVDESPAEHRVVDAEAMEMRRPLEEARKARYSGVDVLKQPDAPVDIAEPVHPQRIFVAQRDDITVVKPNRETDREFADALQEGQHQTGLLCRTDAKIIPCPEITKAIVSVTSSLTGYSYIRWATA